MSRLGLVTIGQAPRVDVTPDIAPLLVGMELLERGALDELDAAEIAALAPEGDEEMLVSRLRDGGSAPLSEERMRPLVQEAVSRVVADGAEAVLVLCTGRLPYLRASVPLYTAEQLGRGAAQVLVGEEHVGVLVPEPPQADTIGARWRSDLGRDVEIEAADPYTASLDEIAAAGARLAARGAEWVFLDCIGYSEAMADAVRRAAPVKALTARGLAARLVAAAV